MEKSKPASPYKTITHEQLLEALPHWISDSSKQFPNAGCVGDIALILASQESENQHNEDSND